MTTMNSEIETTNESNEEVSNSSYEINTWDELSLSSEILRGIYAHGFEMPSPIQKKAIKPLMEKKDIIAQAQSGTGKTATFTIGALANIDLSSNTTQVLVMSPTKELTMQTGTVFKAISQFMPGLRIQLAYGGSIIEEGSSFSSRKVPHIICGCPGRVQDMMRRDKISSKKIKLVILDEADEMLSAGFKDQMYNIFQNFGPDIQVALFSATLPDSLEGIIEKIMRNPVRISVKREMLTLEGIKQYLVAVDDDRQKYATLKDLYKYITASQTIIYCNSIKRVQDLYEAMREDEFPVCRIHGNMDKKEREATFNEFRNGSSRVLISSNVTARGIDIQQVNIVINFDIPKDVHTYLHRIGRSGRWGRKGMGLNFVTRRDIQKLREIENHYKTQMMELPENLEGCFLR
jgi:superfamily II DNA/RNA helicase